MGEGARGMSGAGTLAARVGVLTDDLVGSSQQSNWRLKAASQGGGN
jgi:hypothetical protein